MIGDVFAAAVGIRHTTEDQCCCYKFICLWVHVCVQGPNYIRDSRLFPDPDDLST